jgi:hypothetical protein
MTKEREALTKALQALENVEWSDRCLGWEVDEKQINTAITAIKAVLAQPEERNFCQRCGKRRGGDVNYIHTCTPPARGTMAHYTPRIFDDYGNKIV